MKWSTGAANGIADAIGTLFNDGIIDLYAGSMPSDGNNALSGYTLVARITQASGAWVAGSATNGLGFDASAAGILTKAAAETWSGVALATETIGFAVWKTNAADSNASSSTLKRMLLTVSAGGGAEVNLSHLDATLGETVSVTSAAITQPKAAS